MSRVLKYRRSGPEMDPFIELTRKMIADGESFEHVWQTLRARGCNLSDSVAVTMDSTEMTHREAKLAVCHSETWSDFFPSIVRLHDDIEQAIEELALEEDSPITVHGLTSSSSS